MLALLPKADAREILAAFAEAGYSEAGLRRHLGSVQLPTGHLRNEPRLLDRTREPITLNTLLHLFWLDRSVPIALAEQTLPAHLLGLLHKAGLLRMDGDCLISEVMLLPVDGFLVASDHPSSIERNEGGLVLWPNPTSKFLGRFTVRRHSAASLDLGTGSGILSLWAAKHSDKVVATDLNPRAASFVEFNARLNGITNIEVLTGDSLQPVLGRRFDLILCNPPFFITPRNEYLFCENPMELDSLCRKLIRDGAEHLNEGGYLEMLCEWAQVEGQLWEDRVAEWVGSSGCDVWVMKGHTQVPEEYAQQRIREKSSDPSKDAETYRGYVAYYHERKVQAIHDGLIVMRKRAGRNWVRIEEVPKTPTGDLGQTIVSMFAAHDYLQRAESDVDLLESRPRLSENARLEQIHTQQDDGWKMESLTLRLVSGFPFHVSVQPIVAEFLVYFNGSRTVKEVVEAFAAAKDASLQTVERECLAILRKLIERGFLLAEDEELMALSMPQPDREEALPGSK